MVRIARYDSLEALEADINDAAREGAWALHSWHPNTEYVESSDVQHGVIRWPVTFFYAMFVKVQEQPKPQGMKAR